ncbi:uncharacterized protein F5147DRAFT_681183 [Suillus discolor]|uniref:SMODS and SLOG-associating 2TM effector domain-containing protein n=1 Tax=Suillus discolor TaxID=1912936 RepID=A0A9P7FBP4_9AGAM|nr:uncharacterized protein F5147DRAFT_681183 [Suillus discolor]KAG2113487.1 hypothetical protein F5147DRAFT_681183 [Suillus discolor]
MNPDHDFPPIPTGQSSQSQAHPSQSEVQEPSPSVEPERVDRAISPHSQFAATEKPPLGSSESAGDRPQSQDFVASDKPLIGSSEGQSPGRTPAYGRYPEFDISQPPPVARNGLRDGQIRRGPSRRSATGHGRPNGSGIGWIVPEIEDKPHRHTIGFRLAPTIANAKTEREQYAAKARVTGLALNIAIGLQVALGALTTGISASLTGRQTSIGISILGGMTTLVASYLARTRGSNEPELSITRVKDLDHFLRDCSAFDMDKGHEYGTPELDAQLDHLRRRFEELLGNADGQRKLSPPV